MLPKPQGKCSTMVTVRKIDSHNGWRNMEAELRTHKARKVFANLVPPATDLTQPVASGQRMI